MFSVVLPAGVGVREGVLVLILAPVTSTSAATAVVVISRFLTVAADVVFALGRLGLRAVAPPGHLPGGARSTTTSRSTPT